MSRRRVSQTELSSLLGRSQPWLSNRLTGQISFKISELQEISSLLKADVSTLILECV